MKRFRFPLTPVKVVRTREKQRAGEQFAAAVRAHGEAVEALAAARLRVARLEEAMRADRGPGFRAAAAALGFAAYRREAAAEEAAGQRAQAARAEADSRRAAYLEARRRLEIVNRLESRARAAHRAAAQREEQAELDELAGRARAAARARSPL